MEGQFPVLPGKGWTGAVLHHAQDRHGNRPPSPHHHTAGIKNVAGTEPPFLLLLLGSHDEKAFPHAIPYLDAVEGALCFGWIDSTRKKTASGFLAQRLTPRSRKSKWSELNKERVRRLTRLGLMTPLWRKMPAGNGPGGVPD